MQHSFVTDFVVFTCLNFNVDGQTSSQWEMGGSHWQSLWQQVPLSWYIWYLPFPFFFLFFVFSFYCFQIQNKLDSPNAYVRSKTPRRKPKRKKLRKVRLLSDYKTYGYYFCAIDGLNKSCFSFSCWPLLSEFVTFIKWTFTCKHI